MINCYRLHLEHYYFLIHLTKLGISKQREATKAKRKENRNIYLRISMVKSPCNRAILDSEAHNF